jgi:hypothetical protein
MLLMKNNTAQPESHKSVRLFFAYSKKSALKCGLLFTNNYFFCNHTFAKMR